MRILLLQPPKMFSRFSHPLSLPAAHGSAEYTAHVGWDRREPVRIRRQALPLAYQPFQETYGDGGASPFCLMSPSRGLLTPSGIRGG